MPAPDAARPLKRLFPAGSVSRGWAAIRAAASTCAAASRPSSRAVVGVVRGGEPAAACLARPVAAGLPGEGARPFSRVPSERRKRLGWDHCDRAVPATQVEHRKYRGQ